MNVSEFNKTYGKQVRTRVCGILLKESSVLLVKHQPLGPKGFLWSPPGGKVEYGMGLRENLEREFLEETGLQVATGNFLFMNEYRVPPIHAIEIFFEVKMLAGILRTGQDPELSENDQLIKEVKYVDFELIKQNDPLEYHNIFRYCTEIQDLLNQKGFFKFENI